MPEISLDYIVYLETKWKSYLRKKPHQDINCRVIVEAAVRDALDDMKNQTEVGMMLYNLFYQQLRKSQEELKAYSLYLKKNK